MDKVVSKIIKKKGLEQKIKSDNRLYIISGANGYLGESYLTWISENENSDTIALSRSQIINSKYESYGLDLSESNSCNELIQNLNLSSYDEIIYVHPVGGFLFEENIEKNNVNIEEKIFKSNVDTFTNLVLPLLNTISENQHLTTIAFGSISDKYNVPYWSSYSKSKNYLRSILKEYTQKKINFSNIFVNVSTVDTGNENKLRPNPLDKEHWLRSDEIVESTMKYIYNPIPSYLEVDIYKKSPYYNNDFFTNHDKVLKRWKDQMES